MFRHDVNTLLLCCKDHDSVQNIISLLNIDKTGRLIGLQNGIKPTKPRADHFNILGQDFHLDRNSINIRKNMPDVFMQALELSTLDEEQSEGEKTEAGGETAERDFVVVKLQNGIKRALYLQESIQLQIHKSNCLMPRSFCACLSFSLDRDENVQSI